MAKGADDDYWEGTNLPSVFKHDLLQRYMPAFGGMTGSQSAGGRLVYLDGYAGRGRYADGRPGSAERIMAIAENQKALGRQWTCFFVEKEGKSAAALREVAGAYVRRGVDARSHHGSVEDVLPQVLAQAAGVPLFLFLDPTGLGQPYEQLVGTLTGARHTLWPPTEVLLNFSLEAVRRIGGHATSPNGTETSMRRLDTTLGGAWWRDIVRRGDLAEAVAAISDQFAQRLGSDTGMHVVTVPVRRAPGQKPLYNLVFGTRRQHGLWVFGDAVARATETWWDSLEEVETLTDPYALFSLTATIRPKLAMVEREAVPAISTNLAEILREVEAFTVVDRTLQVFGHYYGQVRDITVRDAVKHLYADGGTSCSGKGGKPRDLVVTRPQLPAAREGISS